MKQEDHRTLQETQNALEEILQKKLEKTKGVKKTVPKKEENHTFERREKYTTEHICISPSHRNNEESHLSKRNRNHCGFRTITSLRHLNWSVHLLFVWCFFYSINITFFLYHLNIAFCLMFFYIIYIRFFYTIYIMLNLLYYVIPFVLGFFIPFILCYTICIRFLFAIYIMLYPLYNVIPFVLGFSIPFILCYTLCMMFFCSIWLY